MKMKLVAITAMMALALTGLAQPQYIILDDPNIDGNHADLWLIFGDQSLNDPFIFTLEFPEPSINSEKLLERVQDAVGYPWDMAMIWDTQSVTHIEYLNNFDAGEGWRFGGDRYWYRWTKEGDVGIPDQGFVFHPWPENIADKVITNGDADAYLFFREPVPNGLVPTPEPTTALMLVFGAAILIGRRVR